MSSKMAGMCTESHPVTTVPRWWSSLPKWLIEFPPSKAVLIPPVCEPSFVCWLYDLELYYFFDLELAPSSYFTYWIWSIATPTSDLPCPTSCAKIYSLHYTKVISIKMLNTGLVFSCCEPKLYISTPSSPFIVLTQDYLFISDLQYFGEYIHRRR